MFLKHIGKHNDRKVVIVFREVPGEEHMALVVYPETLPISMSEDIMRIVQSPEAQNADTLGDVLFRNMFKDGNPILQTLHKQRMMKKVQTANIMVTPTASSSCRLDELNHIINQIKSGESAFEKLQELDKNAGISGKTKARDALGQAIKVTAKSPSTIAAGGNSALDDSSIAQGLRSQAAKMESEAKGLLAESARLMKEAADMEGVPVASAPKRGRKAKVASAA